jgi:hypothetical protein
MYTKYVDDFSGSTHCLKYKAEFRSIERGVMHDGMKLQREKYSDDFKPYYLPELFQGCEKLEKIA